MLSKTKIENVTCLALNFLNILLYLLVIAAACYKCINSNFSQIVLSIYGAIIAAALTINEIQSPLLTQEYFRFMCIYRGRGLIFFFFGCLVLGEEVLNIIVGTLTLSWGLFYIILSFIASIPPPNSLVINWQNWKDFSAEGLDLSRPRNSTIESVAAIQLKGPPRPSSSMAQPTISRYSNGYSLTEADMGDWRVDSDYGSVKEGVQYVTQPSSEYDGSFVSPVHSPRTSGIASPHMGYSQGQRW
ncbi:hypothetical protein K450DRAFT_251220 [Umbelopsis ramanniana AG]|uniref:COPI associated protein n=1 Tax=Umbelopsis ramanniana AG TaxID=1314678 RepID=A0AAD5HB23_UMBRA|nr:uncharacterized protein K450DRAFT_251220 [Umbelopsis ramanniana AG]KAI8577680.1 hypothetical protein K450DRAFT_251220 [Umbelopsis ramanniana AG]